MATVKINDASNGKGIEVRILKPGRYDLTSVEVTIEATTPKKGKQSVKLATVSGLQNGKQIAFKTVDMELIDAIKAFSEVNDTDALSFDAELPEGSRYLDWTLVQ